MTDNIINFNFNRNEVAPQISNLYEALQSCITEEKCNEATGAVILFDCNDGVRGIAINVTNGDMLWLAENLRMLALGKAYP